LAAQDLVKSSGFDFWSQLGPILSQKNAEESFVLINLEANERQATSSSLDSYFKDRPEKTTTSARRRKAELVEVSGPNHY
jgi:hypothetical protein